MRLYQKLFLSFLTLLFILFATITSVQYQRERDAKANQLDIQLMGYNAIVDNYIKTVNDNWEDVNNVVYLFPDTFLRTTIIDTLGNVFYDSYVSDTKKMENHHNRPEFLQAMQTGYGKSVRHSKTTGKEYYYFASRFGEYLVRTAQPYNVELKAYLKANMFFIYFTLIVFLLASIALYLITRNFTKSIDRMRVFTERAKNGEVLSVNLDFPKDELGEISSNMVMLYKQLAKTKNELVNEREKLINHLRISQEGLGIFSKDKKEILINPTFIQYTSFLLDKNEATSDEIFDLPEFKSINRFIDHTIENQMRRKRMTIKKYGRYFLLQCVVFHDDTFEISISDTTIQEHENELKKELTQNISHELKTPVSSIMGYMESILDNPSLEPERQLFFIKRSYQQALRLSSLLQDIATLNKLDEKRKIYEKEIIDVRTVLMEVLNDVKPELEEKNLTILHNLEREITIKGNSSLLYSIFRNLIDNASAYAGENITIEISQYREDDRYYYFSFADNGTGVSEDHLKRLFERFYRVDKGRSRKMGGTGLGLAIVKNAVLYHKGKISVKQTVGGGLTFIFSLKKK